MKSYGLANGYNGNPETKFRPSGDGAQPKRLLVIVPPEDWEGVDIGPLVTKVRTAGIDVVVHEDIDAEIPVPSAGLIALGSPLHPDLSIKLSRMGAVARERRIDYRFAAAKGFEDMVLRELCIK